MKLGHILLLLSQTGAVRPKRPSTDFLIIGDWGNEAQIKYLTNIAQQMNLIARNTNPISVITVGNNFYPSLSGPNDIKFQKLWLDVFTDETSRIPWWTVMGNNEWFQDYRAQIEYFHLNSRFYMPDFFYDLTVYTDNDLSLGFVFLDTNLLWYSYHGENENMARNFADAGYSMENKTIEKQLVKIENMLKAHDDKDYVFVIGHHYISTCPTNDSNHAFNFLNDIFIKHRISAYIFGHHHSLQSVQKDGIIYIQSGTGGQNHGLCKGMDGWGAAEFGFTNLQVTKKNSFFTFISSNGTALHTEVAKPRLKSRLLKMQNDKQVFTEAS